MFKGYHLMVVTMNACVTRFGISGLMQQWRVKEKELHFKEYSEISKVDENATNKIGFVA